MQDELDFEVGEQSKLTEADMLDALYARYRFAGGNGQRYAVAAQVRSQAGYHARRTATSLPWTCGRPSGSPCTATR